MEACGSCAGAWSVEASPALEPSPERAFAVADAATSREAAPLVALLTLLPENALAATAVSTPVSVTVPASTHRRARENLRSAASRALGVCLPTPTGAAVARFFGARAGMSPW
jgi:hypothetical protein